MTGDSGRVLIQVNQVKVAKFEDEIVLFVDGETHKAWPITDPDNIEPILKEAKALMRKITLGE